MHVMRDDELTLLAQSKIWPAPLQRLLAARACGEAQGSTPWINQSENLQHVGRRVSYQLEFTISGLPKTGNQLLRGHWSVKHGHAKMWKMRVYKACWHLRPEKPLKRAKLTLTRVSSVETDFDNRVSSFKPIIDGLVQAKVLAGDKQENIGQPSYVWERGKPGEGCVRVRVEEVL